MPYPFLLWKENFKKTFKKKTQALDNMRKCCYLNAFGHSVIVVGIWWHAVSSMLRHPCWPSLSYLTQHWGRNTGGGVGGVERGPTLEDSISQSGRKDRHFSMIQGERVIRTENERESGRE